MFHEAIPMDHHQETAQSDVERIKQLGFRIVYSGTDVTEFRTIDISSLGADAEMIKTICDQWTEWLALPCIADNSPPKTHQERRDLLGKLSPSDQALIEGNKLRGNLIGSVLPLFDLTRRALNAAHPDSAVVVKHIMDASPSINELFERFRNQDMTLEERMQLTQALEIKTIDCLRVLMHLKPTSTQLAA